MAEVTLFRESCKGVHDCGICMFVCPKQLYRASQEMNDAGYVPTEHKDETKCVGCLNCMIYCPDFAIVVEKDGNYSGLEKESEWEGRER